MTTQRNWASITLPTVVFVGIADREEFERLALPATDHRKREVRRNVLTESLEADGVMVVFQHWLAADSPDYLPELGGASA